MMQSTAYALMVRRSFTLPVLFAIFMLVALYSSVASAASCNIVPLNPVISEGGSINFSLSISGKWRGQKTYDWQFPGGSPNSSDQPTVTVTYATAGSYAVTFDGTSNKDGPVSCTTTVIVNQGGGNNAPVCSIDTPANNVTITVGGTVDYTGTVTDANNDPVTISWNFPGGTPSSSSAEDPGTVTYNTVGTFTTTLDADDGQEPCPQQSRTITVDPVTGGGEPVARGDDYATPVGTTLDVPANRLSGVLYNDFDNEGDPLTAQLVSGPSNGSLNFNNDGSFTYTPNAGLSDNDVDSFTYQASDGTNLSAETTVNILILSKQTDFKIMMNYELGMHCTGFEFAYCCVLPVYNSILAQVVKPVNGGDNDFPYLLEDDPNNNVTPILQGGTGDVLGRHTVMRDPQLDDDGNFQKYVLRYWKLPSSSSCGSRITV